MTDTDFTADTAPVAQTQTHASVLAPAPATSARWQPLRLGLVDLFYYDDQVFPFVDGRLLLRGNNGAGKSKVLALTLPFLLDGDLSPQRIEPDGDRQKRMEWNLLLGDEHPNNERIGYSWLEFGRIDENGAARYVTIGAGLKASRGRGITKHWFFVTEQRVGPELSLTDSTRVALGQARLAEALGEHGTVYTTKAEYRRAVDEKLFSLGERRYGELIELLLQIRAPQLSKRPSETALDEALSRSLTPVGDDVIKAVADGLRSLDEQRDELTQLADAQRSVQTFLGHYRGYARVLLRRQADAPRREQGEHDRQGRDIIVQTVELEAARSVETEAVESLRGLRVEQLARLAERDGLRDSEHAQSESRIALAAGAAEEAEEHHSAVQRRAETVEQTKKSAGTAAEAARLELDQRQQTSVSASGVAHAAAEASGIVADHAAVLGTLAVLAADQHERALDALGDEGDSSTDLSEAAHRLAADRTATSMAIERARTALERVSELLRQVAEAERRLASVTASEADADTRLAAESEARSDAESAVEVEVAEYIARIEIELAALRELSIDDGAFDAFTAWVRVREAANPAILALQASAAERRAELGPLRAAAQGRFVECENQIAALTAEITGLQRGETHEPPLGHTRLAAASDAMPFWRTVSFVDSVSDTARAGFEAALEASGLLTGLLLTDGALRSASDGELLLMPGSPVAARSLGEVLRVDLASDSSVSASAVEAVLASIALFEPEEEAVVSAGSPPVWVSQSGAFGLGPARGRWHSEAARYIGETARADARMRRILGAEQERASAERERDAAREQRAQLDRRLKAVDAEALALSEPRDLANADRAAVLARERCTRTNDELEDARHAVAVASAAQNELRHELEADALLLGLPDDAAAIDSLAESLRVYDKETTVFWSAVELLVAARRSADAAEARLLQAQTDHAEVRSELAVALEHARSKRAYADTVHARLSASAEEYHAQVTAVEFALNRLDTEIKTLDGNRESAALDAARLGARIEGLSAELERSSERRRVAVEALRRTTELGIALVALPELEIPDAAEEWTATRGVQFARAVEVALSDVDSSDARYDKLATGLHEQITELHRTLGRHDYEIVVLQPEAGVRVFVVIKGRETILPVLADNLAEQYDYHERMLSAREREIIQNHLVTEVGAQLSELIGDADRQIAELNDELKLRPTSTGMKLRVQWRPRGDGPSGLASARKLLGTASEVWSPEDRDALGAFLQARIAEVRSADEAGNWYDHLGAALDYRRWHHFAVERRQAGAWKPATGPASGGERVLAASIPMFAAASSHYRTAGNKHAPRLIMLDEAFAGVDDDSRANCLGLLAHFDLDVVMTSEREWGCYAEVPGLSIAQLSRFDETPAVFVQLWRWDGQSRTAVGDGALEQASGELW